MFIVYLLTRMKKNKCMYNVEVKVLWLFSILIDSPLFFFLFPSYRVVIAPRYIVQTSTT